MATLQEKLALLKDLEDENESVQSEIDDLMTEMARVPAGRSAKSVFAPVNWSTASRSTSACIRRG